MSTTQVEREYSRTDLSEERQAALAACDSQALASLLRDVQDVNEMAEWLRDGLDAMILDAAGPSDERSGEPLLTDSQAWEVTCLVKDVSESLEMIRSTMEEAAENAYVLNVTPGDLPGRLVHDFGTLTRKRESDA